MKTLKLLYAQVRAKYRKEKDSQSAKEQHKKSPPETCGENYFQTNSILAVKKKLLGIGSLFYFPVTT